MALKYWVSTTLKKWKAMLTIAVLREPDNAGKDSADVFLYVKDLSLLFSSIIVSTELYDPPLFLHG